MIDPDRCRVSCAIAVFARPPRLGQVKTRLAAGVGDEAALRIYRQLLEKTLRQVSVSGLPFTLFTVAPSSELTELAHRHGGDVALQHGDGLGERMTAAFSEMHNLADAVILIGSDCPVLTSEHLLSAQQELAQSRVVLGPAEDGGYWLIGSASESLWRESSVFDGVQFGGSQALSMTVRGLQRAGVSASMLQVLWDLDTEQDYRRACALGILGAGDGEEGMNMKATAPLDMELVGELKEIMAEGFATLVESYQRDSAQRLVSMQDALAAEDRGLLRQLAHSLKGSSSNLGAVQVTALCIALEGRATEAPASELHGLLEALNEAYVAAIEALQGLCQDS